MRNKLIELICEGTQKTGICTTETYMDCEPCRGDCGYCVILADHLLANGVTMIPETGLLSLAPDNNVGHKWIPVKERLPERNGKYMVYASVRGRKYIDCVSFAQDLYRIDPYDFHGSKGKSGFYTYDNEYGFGEYEGVTHWMPLPSTEGLG